MEDNNEDDKQPSVFKYFISILGVLGLIIVVWFLDSIQTTKEYLEEVYANDSVMLYKTVGIKDCINDQVVYTGTEAVRLLGDDLDRTLTFFGGRLHNIIAVLYINAPETSKQPALIALQIIDGVYCSRVVSGSYSVPLFLELKEKYQSQIE